MVPFSWGAAGDRKYFFYFCFLPGDLRNGGMGGRGKGDPMRPILNLLIDIKVID